MRYEGDAPLYSAWAIIAIESLWPNPDGDELTPDADDLELYSDEETSSYKSSQRQSFGEAASGESNDYQRTQGYYKILPLNILSVNTQTSVDTGNSWSATFTLDDLILVTSEDNMNHMRSASGIPMSPSDLIESDIDGALPYLIHDDRGESEIKYIKDSQLGLSRYRISGRNSGFNVGDLVTENDTVTIWIYHDPSDFYFKDEVPEFEGDYLKPNDKVTSVIGSGDRRSQVNTQADSFDETLLGRLGIINEIMSESIETLLASGTDEETVTSQVPTIGKDNVHKTTMNHLDILRGNHAITVNKFSEYLTNTTNATFPNLSEAQLSRVYNYLSVSHNPYTTPAEQYEEEVEDEEVAEIPLEEITTASDERGSFIERRVKGNATLGRIIGMLKETGEADGIPFYYEKSDYTAAEWDAMMREATSNGLDKISTDEDLENYIEGLNHYTMALNRKSQEFATEYLQRRVISRTRQTFVNGRTALIDGSHGETPYLALKGVISRVETNVGAGANSFTITIGGEGMEKVLNTTEVYYEDSLFPGGVIGPVADHATIYINMTPPDAVRHLVNRWAAKQFVIGEKNAFTKFTNNTTTYMGPLGVEEDEETEVVDTEDYDKDVEVVEGKIVVRGYRVQRKYQGTFRDFVPVNYIDSTRLGETSRAISTVYAETQENNFLNVPVELDNRRPVLENARMMTGPAQLYELFVDEMGKIRHRLSFEAMERTPKPEYTPTIQDYDLLAEGSTFFHDDTRLSTLVDVRPYYSQSTGPTTSWAISGRSMPETGEVPLQDLGPLDGSRDLLSPDLFRYGLRSITVEDIYQRTHEGAQIKAEIYRQFYGTPIKRASVMVRNNTSYRAGETVLVALQKNKMRSRTLIDLSRLWQWLVFLEGEPDLMRMYIGVDARMLQRGKESFSMTAGEYNPFGDSTVTGTDVTTGADLYQEFNKDPHLFVLKQFKETILFMIRNLPGINVVTPDYFPTLYWYFHHKPGGAYGWDENRVGDEYIIQGYENMLRATVGDDSVAQNALRELLTVPMESKDASGNTVTNIGLINLLRFQNFRAQSYYINSVSHNFAHGSEARTTLNLDFGQDNLVLLDPVNLSPFGFLSLERKVKIGYRDPVQESLWSEPFVTQSSMQRLYTEQFKEDDLYKRSSFLHNAQSLRNASNYMYELAVVREGMNTFSTTLESTMQSQPLQSNQVTSTGAVTPNSPDTFVPTVVDESTVEGTITPGTQQLINRALGPLSYVSPWYEFEGNAGDLQKYYDAQQLRIYSALVRVGNESAQHAALEEFENLDYAEYRGDRLLEFLEERTGKDK